MKYYDNETIKCMKKLFLLLEDYTDEPWMVEPETEEDEEMAMILADITDMLEVVINTNNMEK